MTRRASRLYAQLPLFWKVLLPFLTLMLAVGGFGVFLIVRNLSARANVALDQDLARLDLAAQASLRDRELYLLEAANFAANIEGMTGAISRKDDAAIGGLLQSVLALKTDLALVAVTDRVGVGRVEFTRAAPGQPSSFGRGIDWSRFPFVAGALTDPEGRKSAGLLEVGGRTLITVVAPVCTAAGGCAAVGAAIVGLPVEELAAAATGKAGPDRSGAEAAASVALYDGRGRLVARAGSVPVRSQLDEVRSADSGRTTYEIGATELASVYSPLQVQGEKVGTVGVTVPTAPALDGVREAALRLVLVVLLAMAGVVAIGAFLSRSIRRQVIALVETNRSLGAGNLAARAPVLGDDELGELARGVNQMADQLQASYETLELRVDQRTEEVRRLLRDRTDFFAGLSHELRTPLAIVLTQVEMLRSLGDDAVTRAEAVDTIDGSATELLELVNDILELARSEAGSVDVVLEPVVLSEVLGDLGPMLVRLGAASDVTVELHVPRRLPPAEADRRLLRDAVLNLVDNAVKYTPAGGRIEISAAAVDGAVEVTVADTGIGIPPEVGERIFEPFYRVPGSRPQRDQPSTGLGLALTRRWIEAQHGTIGWEPGAGGGTIFRFTLPLAALPARRRSRKDEAVSTVSAASPS